MSSSVRDITESTEAEGRDDTHQKHVWQRLRHLGGTLTYLLHALVLILHAHIAAFGCDRSMHAHAPHRMPAACLPHATSRE